MSCAIAALQGSLANGRCHSKGNSVHQRLHPNVPFAHGIPCEGPACITSCGHRRCHLRCQTCLPIHRLGHTEYLLAIVSTGYVGASTWQQATLPGLFTCFVSAGSLKFGRLSFHPHVAISNFALVEPKSAGDEVLFSASLSVVETPLISLLSGRFACCCCDDAILFFTFPHCI